MMQTEWEATFWPIEKEVVRTALKELGATQLYPERAMKRVVFHLHPDAPLKKAWARVRDEGDKITMSIKQSGTELDEQKELELTINDFENGVEFLRSLGCIERAFQETRRELWHLDEVNITIDEWPFIPPFIEVEGKSEDAIRNAAQKLGHPWDTALFCSIDELYIRHYGLTKEQINIQTPRLAFDDPNPFRETGKQD